MAHFGVGVDLRTGRPTAEQIGEAVRRILGDDGWSRRARQMAAAMARYDALATVESELEAAGTGSRELRHGT